MLQLSAFFLKRASLLLLVIACSAFFPLSPAFAARATPAAKDSGKVNLFDSVKTALAYNPDLKAVQEKRIAADAAIDKARAGYLPTVTASGGTNYSQRSNDVSRTLNQDKEFRVGYDAGIRLTLPLWQGGLTQAEVRTRKAQYESADNQLEDRGTSLAFEAIVAHTEVLRRSELTTLAKNNVQEHASILATVRERYNNKVATTGELHQMESRYSRSKATLLAYESGLDAAKASYLNITGQSPRGLISPHMPDLKYVDTDAIRAACIENNRRIKSAEADIAASKGEKDMASSRFYPSFYVDAGPTWSDRDAKGPFYNSDLGVSLRGQWELFSGWADVANVSIADSRIRQSRQNLHTLMNSLNEDIESTFSRYHSSLKQMREYDSAKRSSRLARQDYYKQFISAQRSLIDVLDAENDYFYAATQQVIAKGDRIIAAYRLMAITGSLLPTLSISPGSLRNNAPTTPVDGPDAPSSYPTPLRVDYQR